MAFTSLNCHHKVQLHGWAQARESVSFPVLEAEIQSKTSPDFALGTSAGRARAMPLAVFGSSGIGPVEALL